MPNKKPSKSLKSKIWKMTKSDIFTSIAIVSIALNLLLLSGIFVISSGKILNPTLVDDVVVKYCDNSQSYGRLSDYAAAKGIPQKQAIKEYEIVCQRGKFAPYYEQALNAYNKAENK